MPELRKDPIVGRWVIISTDRAKRPTDFVRENMKIKGDSALFATETKVRRRLRFKPIVRARMEGLRSSAIRPDGPCGLCRTSFQLWGSKAI